MTRQPAPGPAATLPDRKSSREASSAAITRARATSDADTNAGIIAALTSDAMLTILYAPLAGDDDWCACQYANGLEQQAARVLEAIRAIVAAAHAHHVTSTEELSR